MTNLPAASIKRAKELLNTILFATMATVNEDFTPHNTPFLFMRDENLTHIYWGSHPNSIHSKNILRTGHIFVVLYDAFNKGGLYLSANQGKSLEGNELTVALKIHNQVRKKLGKDPINLKYYMGGSPQKMWSAKINKIWVNDTQRDTNGHLVRDIRVEIKANQLTK